MEPKFTKGQKVKFGFGRNHRHKGVVSDSLYFERPDGTKGFTYQIKADFNGEIYAVMESGITAI